MGRESRGAYSDGAATAFSMKNILVTGGLGAIGSALCRTLLGRDSARLVIIDDCSSGPEELCRDVLGDTRTTFVRGSITDDAVLKELGSRFAQYRLNMNLTQGALANEAGISERTLIRVEHGESTQTTNLIRILRALQLLGNMDALIPEPVASPIQQVRLQGRQRRRASVPSPSSPQTSKKPWSWSDEP